MNKGTEEQTLLAPQIEEQATTPEGNKEESQRSLTRYQVQMLPVLSLPLFLTAFLAYRLSHVLGPAWFALHPTGELSAIIGMVCSVIAGKLEEPSTMSEWRQALYAFVAWLCALGGFIVIFTVKQQYDMPHFRSLHSHLGVLSFTAIMLYTIVSFVAFNPLAKKHKISPKALQNHGNVGRLIVMAGLLTASVGILELEPHTIPNALAWIGSLSCFLIMLF